MTAWPPLHLKIIGNKAESSRSREYCRDLVESIYHQINHMSKAIKKNKKHNNKLILI